MVSLNRQNRMKNDSILYKRIEVPQPIKALAFGVLTMFGIWIITNIINFEIFKLSTAYRYDFSSHQINIPPIIQLFYWATYALRLCAPVFAGIVIGKMMKKQYFKYTFLLGIISNIIPVFIALTYLVWSDRLIGQDLPLVFIQSYVYKSLFRQLIAVPKTILLAVAGGYMGNKLGK